MLKAAPWQRVTWRTGTKGALTAAFAALRVRVADGPPQRHGTPLPGDELWLVGERRSGGDHKYYLSNKPADAALSALARQIKARWVCDQGHQQMKDVTAKRSRSGSTTARDAVGTGCIITLSWS
jgi:hypothetical protein